MISNWLIQYGSWCLAPFGLMGMYVVGRKKTWGWIISMVTQALWATYAVGTGQFGFLLGTVSYFVIYLRSWLKWRRDDMAAEVVTADVTGVST
jgi:nicotinamide riboside transporter PnuC